MRRNTSKQTVRWLTAAMALAGASSTRAATLNFIGASGEAWSNPANWYDATNDLNDVLPTSADVVHLGGKTINIDSYAAVLSAFASGSGGIVHINDGASLTGANSNGYTVRYVNTINVNDGGTFPMGTGWTLRSTVNVNAGGVASGGAGITQTEQRTITVAGTWSPRGTTLASGTVFTLGTSSQSGAKVDLVDGGKIILDVYGDNSNERFQVNGMTSATRLRLNTGTVELRLQGGYVPEVGHQFDLWNLATDSLATMEIGDGSNIVLPGYTLDTSLWASQGIVSVIPEPAALSLLSVAGLALLRRRR